MKISLSDHFTYKKLLKFTFPSIMMMIFTSIYGVVDGFFVSNYVGKTPFAAVNFIYPYFMILSAFGFMIGSGGSALISKKLGEKRNDEANGIFSLLTVFSIACGIISALLGILLIRPVASALGATGELFDNSVLYGTILLSGLPFFNLQMAFQSFFVTAEKPGLGFAVTVISGVSNIILDFLLVGIAKFGLAGAAFATLASEAVGGIIPIVYFMTKNTSLLRFTKPSFDFNALLRTCTNGSSELLSNISMSLVGMLYNYELMKYAGENGVSAYGIIMYIDMIFFAVFIGYAIGMAPIVGFHFGARNTSELKNLLKKSIVIQTIAGIAMFVFAEIFSKPLGLIFASYDKELLDMTVHGFRIYSISFLFTWVSIFGSSFFTALNNGLVSLSISFLKTVVYECLAVFLLPMFFGLEGVWYAVIISRLLGVSTTILFFIFNKKKYQY